MNTEVTKLRPEDVGDFSKLLRIFKAVFAVKNFKQPSREYLERLLRNPDFLAFVAREGSDVVGGLTVHVLHLYYSDRPSAYIYDIGVLPNYQRRGIGKMLVTHLLQYCKENGFAEVFVQAETDDTPALAFYRATNSSNEQQATHFTYTIQKTKRNGNKQNETEKGF